MKVGFIKQKSTGDSILLLLKKGRNHPMSESEKKQRWKIFRELIPYYGKLVSPDFLRKTSLYISSVERIHPLIEGIYKPAWSDHCMSIASMKSNPYEDKITYLPDGRWHIKYSPKKGELNSAVNSSLFACLKDKEPVIVLEQVSDKMDMHGAKYRIMGLGLIENYDPKLNVFHIQHVDYSTLELVSNGNYNEVFYESVLREIALDRFSPFIAEDKAIYQVTKEKRDQAFKRVVLEQYGYQCAVTGLKYHSGNLIEAQAAHIISKSKKGSDDPRNGITLSRTAHWAFDKGIFTISDQYEIIVHPKAKNASLNKFTIMDMHGIQINLPEDENYYPHPEAIEWHKREVFDRFDL
jgi:hypothetical protein